MIVPRWCPRCESRRLVLIEPGSILQHYLCRECVGDAAIESYLKANGFRWEERAAPAAPAAPTCEHSPAGEPLTVDDLLYETLGYYS